MAKQVINVGTTTNDRTGDSIRLAFQKVNANFTEVYNALNNEPSRRDIVGSIFADDSTLLVDATLGRIVGPIYSSTAEIGNIEISGNTIATTDSSAITIDQVVNLGSDVNVGGDLLPNVANGGNLGSSAKPWGSLYVSNNTIYIGGQAISINDQGELTYNGNRVAHENGEFMTLDNLSDLNVNSPNAGDTIAWAGYQWVNVPLTQHRLADDGDEVVLVGGANPYVTFPAITGGDQLIIQGAEVSSVSGSLALTSQDNLNIIANGSGAAPGGSKNWTFSADGSLTIPGDIRSDSNINIEINLADSTLRRWQFGEDGELTLPSVGKINNGAYDWTFGSTGNTTFPTGLTLSAARGPSTVNFTSGIDKEFQIETQTNTTGKLWQFGTDGSLTLPGDIKSDGNINIDINLSDSTLRRWQFGEDGELTLPEDAVIKTMSGNLTIEGESYVIIDSATNGQIDIGRSSGVGAVSLGNKSNGTNVVVDDLFVASGVYEFFSSLADATGVVTHNCANGHLFYHTSPDTNWTVNLTNLLDTWNRATSVTIIIAQGATGYYPSAVQIAGVAQTINWQGNVTPTPSTNRTDVVRFSIINNSGTYIVLGQLTGF